LLRTSQIGDVGRGLAGEDGVILEAQHLGVLDLLIPISALHKAHRDAAVELAGQAIEPVEDRRRLLGIGLDDHAEAVPAGQVGVAQHGLDDVGRELQPVGLLGVDGHADPGRAGVLRQGRDPGHQLVHHGPALHELVARVQRRELHRDARILDHVVMLGPLGDGRDRGRIGQEITPGVGRGSCGFAQHVVGVAVALVLHAFGSLHGVGDAGAEDELPPEDLHRLFDGDPHHRLAQAPHGLGHETGQLPLVHAGVAQHLAGQHQRPGRGVDQEGIVLAQVAAPIRRADLVADQSVNGRRVRGTQIGLGEAHERDALFRREAVGGEELLHDARMAHPAQGLDQLRRRGGDALAGLGVQGERLQAVGHRRTLVAKPRFCDLVSAAGLMAGSSTVSLTGAPIGGARQDHRAQGGALHA
jgi:hypothetical protein